MVSSNTLWCLFCNCPSHRIFSSPNYIWYSQEAELTHCTTQTLFQLSSASETFGEGNGSPLQDSCLENPVDSRAWWAAIYGVTQSRTQLKRLSMHASLGEGNGNPLQCSCLENPRDREAWCTARYGAAQSWTWLKWFSSSSERHLQELKYVPWEHTPVCFIYSFCMKDMARSLKQP